MQARMLAAVGCAIALGACGGDSGLGRGGPAGALAAGDSAASDVPCTVEHLSSEPIVLGGGREVYVEPQTLVPSPEGGLLLAGSPSYLWRRVVAPTGVLLEASDPFVGVSWGSGGVHAVGPPPELADVRHVRATRLPDGGWGAVMSTGEENDLRESADLFRFEATWYAAHDGEAWSEPELLPRPLDGEPGVHNSSGLIALGDRLIWMVPWTGADRLRRVLEFERFEGRWTYRAVGPPAFVEGLGAAPGRSGDVWLVVAGPDPYVSDWVKSVRLYHRTEDWELVQRVVELGPNASVENPLPVVTRDGIAVTWLEYEGPTSTPKTALDVRAGRTPEVLDLAPEAIQVVPLALADGTPAWVLASSLPSVLSSELRVIVGSPGGPRTVLALPNPFTGYFAAAAHGRRVTIVGPEFDPHPAQPTVRSLIINLGASCQ